MRLVGLTGGIASGKSLVSDAFAEWGAPIVDADLLAREVVAPGSEGLAGLQALFGDSILNEEKALNRNALRQIIFKEPAARAQVDDLLHPLIRSLSTQRIEQHAKQNPAYIVHAIPLLVETGQMDRHDDIVVVDVPVQTQLTRLMERDKCSEEEAQRILDSQATRKERLAIATHVIDNSGCVSRTLDQVQALHATFNALK